MIKCIGFVCTLLLHTPLFSQYWLQKAGGVTIDEATDVALDNNDNVYGVGYFTGMASFGGTFLSATGSTDIFITKTNSQGVFQWARKAGGSGSDRAEAVAADAMGNVYVVGYFSGTALFGSTSLSSSGVQDVFVAKYNSAGVVQWAVKAGGSASDLGFGIDVNNTGDVFVTGSFKGTANFGSHSVVANNNTSDVFVAKLNNSGVFQWVKSGTSAFPNLGRSLGADNYGNVYVTGQFSDTITFDQVHNNQSQNIIYLVKFDSLGAEKWFTTIDGALSNVANDMAVDAAGNCYVTGDFNGVLNVYDMLTGAPTNISSTYSNTIFTVRYDSSGQWNLNNSVGSNNPITSQTICVGATGDFFIGGSFECDFTEYSAYYGLSNFMSVGDKDVFVAKYNSSGTFDYSRNIGSETDDACNGIGVNTANNIHAVGSFSASLHVPVSANFSSSNLSFWSATGCPTNNNYCGDPDYGNYRTLNSQGNKDAFIINGFDPNREPFDFFKRTGTGCVKDYVPVCIENCADTVRGCELVNLNVTVETCTSIAPNVNYNWSNGEVNPTTTVSSTGWYFVTVSHPNSCFELVDSVYVIISLNPQEPHISDGKHFNIDALVTTPIQLCSPDTTQIIGGGFNATDTVWWTGPGLGTGVFDSTIIVSTTGTFTFHVKNEYGCTNVNHVLVKENLPFPPFDLEIIADDSIEVCFPDPFTIQLYDSVTNPTGAPVCMSTNIYTVFSVWRSVPTLQYTTSCDTYGYFEPDSSGTYTIYDTTVRFNYCYSDTFTASKTVYVTVNPKPVVLPFSLSIYGDLILCPGESTNLTATGGPNYTWFGPGVNGQNDSVVTVNTPGMYTVKSTKRDTNSFGCIGQFSMTNSKNVILKSQPVITASDLVICPGSSVTLTSSSFIGNAWEGPNGPISGGGSQITVTDPGQYFSVVTDGDSCGLVSNTVTLLQYTTPTLVPFGDTIICPGQSTIIRVQSNSGSTVTWDAPLTGNSNIQVISSPGTYSCSITSCGITTNASITIHAGNPLAQVHSAGVLCPDSSVVLSGPPGMVSYIWLPGNDTTPSITVDSANTYTLSIVDANGCAGTSAPFILNEINVSANLLNTTLGFCFGDSIILEADSSMSSYYWSPGGQTTSSISVNQPGNYYLTVVDSNGCIKDSDPFTVQESDSITGVILVGDSVICERDTVWLNPVVSGYSSYTWMPGNINVTNLAVTQSGRYSLLAIDTSGCTVGSDTFDILVQDAPISSVSANGILCKDSSLVLEGVSGMASYRWMPGNEVTSDIMVTTAGTYSLVVTDTNGCESLSVPYQVNQINVPAAITNTSFGFCEGDSLQLFANPGMASYLWSPSGDTSSTTTVIETGAVTLTVIDTNGCVETVGPVQVTQSAQFTPISTQGNSIICEGDSVTILASNQSFSGYTWMPGNINSSSITVSQSGNYWLVATDSTGCISYSDSVNVQVVPNNLTAPVVSVDSVVCTGATVLYIANAGSDSIYWYPSVGTSPIHIGDSFTTILNQSTTMYLQTVSFPCESEIIAVDVLAEDCKEPKGPNVFTPNGDGTNDYWGIEILGATCFEVEIYNRWGGLIYTLESQSEYWDGTMERSKLDAPEGTYYYILNYCDYKKDSYSQTGYITLIR